MFKKFFIFILLFVSMPLMASDDVDFGIIEIDYTFEQNSPTTGWIHFSFENTSGMNLCISEWKFIQGSEFQENLFITNLQTGKFIPYNGPSTARDRTLETFFIVPRGEKFPGMSSPGLAFIGDYHDLPKGKHRVQSYALAIECHSLIEGNAPLSPLLLWEWAQSKNFEYLLRKQPSVLLKLDAVIEIK